MTEYPVIIIEFILKFLIIVAIYIYISSENKYRKESKMSTFTLFLCMLFLIILVGIGAVSGGGAQLFIILIVVIGIILLSEISKKVKESEYKRKLEIEQENYRQLEKEVLDALGLSEWEYANEFDYKVRVKSSKAVTDYTDIKYFKDNNISPKTVLTYLEDKIEYGNYLQSFLDNTIKFKKNPQYYKLENKIKESIRKTKTYNVLIEYVSSAGNSVKQSSLFIDDKRIKELIDNPSLLMTKSEYNKYVKEIEKELLSTKQKSYYDNINTIIDLANNTKDNLVIKEDSDKLDSLISQLFEKTVTSISKVKNVSGEEWSVIENYIKSIQSEVQKIYNRNKRILDYYNSEDFLKIKSTCDSLMTSQKEFNEYIDEKVKSIETLFGTRVIRNETVIEDEYNYIRPYKKSITPFTAEVSSAVFASAENNPLDYIIKYFYPNKEQYPEQIQKLQVLIEELETLKDAKQIIENYKKEYQQYLTNVPNYIIELDEDGFYSRLGFATINENTLTVEYKFSYTSNGGMAQRSFTVPMTEETIIELINRLQNKLTQSSFSQEQRRLMTAKLRQFIKERDNYTCQICGNSTYKEPNLLLEIDHIIPVAKGGYTVEDNLQTLCWKCNRHKSSKIIDYKENKNITWTNILTNSENIKEIDEIIS